MNRLLGILFLGLTLGLAVSAKASSADARNDQGAAVSASAAQVKNERKEFFDKVRTDLEQLQADIGALDRKMAKEAKMKFKEEKIKLEQERIEAEKKLTALQSASDETWQKLKSGVTESVDHLKESIKKARHDLTK